MFKYEDIFRNEEAKYRKHRKSISHDKVIESLALIVRGADQLIEHFVENESKLKIELDNAEKRNNLLFSLFTASATFNLIFIISRFI